MPSQTLQEIYKLVKEEKKHVPRYRNAVFDFDNTCIHNDIGEAVLAYLCRHNLLKNPNLVQGINPVDYHEAVFHTYHQYKKEQEFHKAYEFSAKILAGLTFSEVEEIVNKTILEEGTEFRSEKLYGLPIQRGIRVKEDTAELLNFLRENYTNTSIISASPWQVIEYAMQSLGLKFGKWIGVRTVVNNETLTDKVIPPIPVREGKVLCIKRYVNPKIRPILAIGDSANDIPMLYYSTIKVIAKEHTLDQVTETLVKDSRQRFYFL